MKHGFSNSVARQRLSFDARSFASFLRAAGFTITIEQWITFWKRDFRRRHQNEKWKFQSRDWHHRLRDDENYSAKWLYVQENPIRKNLVKRIEDWPYKWKVHLLKW
ncbi:MAG: hypothetical protein ACREFE_02365 [Limisphaerales bacterium]